MREQRQRLARCIAGALVLGTLVVGAVAPVDAATGSAADTQTTQHFNSPADTGWNGN